MTRMAEELNAAVEALSAAPREPGVRAPAPKDFQPGIKYDSQGKPTAITTGPQLEPLESEADFTAAVEAMGVKIPKGYRLRLAEARFDPAAWHRDAPGEDAVTRPVWRYRFIPELVLGSEADEDLAALHKAAKRAARAALVGRPRYRATDMDSMVVVLGDIQAGKVDLRGGTSDLLERLERAKQGIVKQARKMKPAEIVLIDAGDAMEMFESAPGANRTNDLQLTEQVRVWRRIFWDWISTLSRLTDDLKVISVPSNHCAVRAGKQYLSRPDDDFGIEVLAQCADIAGGNPEAFGHVQFFSPAPHEEGCGLTLLGGKVLGVAHGHQKTRPEAVESWMAGQALGRTSVGAADILVIGHWHHLRVQTFGDDRWVFIAPTMDSGSSWFRNINGKESAPGVLSFVVDSEGWRDLHVAWAR